MCVCVCVLACVGEDIVEKVVLWIGLKVVVFTACKFSNTVIRGAGNIRHAVQATCTCRHVCACVCVCVGGGTVHAVCKHAPPTTVPADRML